MIYIANYQLLTNGNLTANFAGMEKHMCFIDSGAGKQIVLSYPPDAIRTTLLIIGNNATGKAYIGVYNCAFQSGINHLSNLVNDAGPISMVLDGQKIVINASSGWFNAVIFSTNSFL